MAKKNIKVKKKVGKKRVEKGQEGGMLESELVIPKKVKERENRQLGWFFFWVIVAFAAFLIPYLYGQSLNRFEYQGLDFDIQDFEQFLIYHSRFPALDGSSINFNIYLRHDPRENNVSVEGALTNFKYGGYISFSPELDQCRGEVSRAVIDLGSFMKTGIGVGSLDVGTTDSQTADTLGKELVNCSTHLDRTVVIVDLGPRQVVKNSDNAFCYTIYVDNCEDVAPIEKFITQTALDMGAGRV